MCRYCGPGIPAVADDLCYDCLTISQEEREWRDREGYELEVEGAASISQTPSS